MILEAAININCKDILDTLPSGVYFTDLERKILYWNKSAEKITGFRADEVVGSHCFNNILMHIDAEGHSLCKTLCPLAKTIHDGSPRHAEVFLHHKDGHRATVNIHTIPLKNTKGNIIGAAEIFSDNGEFTSMKKLVEELKEKTFFDNLLKLPNREHIESELDLKFHEFRRYEEKFGILFLDIDNFKHFNDTFGHEAGDMILKTMAKTLRASSRPFDIFGRWGGDEFVGLLKNVDYVKLKQIANRYRKLIEKTSITIKNKPVGITVSIGATIVTKNDTKNVIINRADGLMYESKKKGGNRLTSD